MFFLRCNPCSQVTLLMVGCGCSLIILKVLIKKTSIQTTTLIQLQQVHLHPPSGFSWALPLGAALLRLVAVPEGLIANLRNLEVLNAFFDLWIHVIQRMAI